MRISIEKNLAENVLNYLASRPYSEVWQLIGAMQQDIKPVTIIDPKAESEVSK